MAVKHGCSDSEVSIRLERYAGSVALHELSHAETTSLRQQSPPILGKLNFTSISAGLAPAAVVGHWHGVGGLLVMAGRLKACHDQMG